MSTKTLTRPAASSRTVSSGRSSRAKQQSLSEQIEGLIATVVRKLMPPPGAGGLKAPYSQEIYRADAIALLIAASQHMGPPATEEDRVIMEMLLEAQQACAN